MKPASVFLTAFLGLLLCTPLVSASDNGSIIQKYQPPQADVYNIAQTNRVLRAGNVWMNTTNWGRFGNYGFSWNDPALPGLPAPQCEFPAGSGVTYVAGGGLWIGAIVQQGTSELPRVSVGVDGWQGASNEARELEPGEWGGLPPEEHAILERSCIPGATNYTGQIIYSPSAIAPQEFISVYTDTLLQQYWTGLDPVDGPHFPLGVRVYQKCMVWDAYGFDDFAICEYTVKNIGNYDLKNLYLGLFADGDVGGTGEGTWFHDDISGLLHSYEGNTWDILYTADNDGRPEGVNVGNDFTCPGVTGVFGLTLPGNPTYTNYNWWMSNSDPELDMGPSWQDDGAPGNWTATFGTPMGDAKKYFLMKNKENDYDQFFVADQGYVQSHAQVFTDPFTGATTTHDWKLEPSTLAWDIANGGDTRYLVSWGPLGYNISPPGQTPETYLYPDSSVTFSIAYVCGEGFHDPQNPQGDVTTGPIDPSKYRYDDLVYNASKAKFLVDHNYQILPPYTPQNLHVIAAPDTALWLTWDTYSTPPETKFNLYKREAGGQYGPNPINPQPISDTTYTDTSVTLGVQYFYKVQAVRYDSLYSYFCPEIDFVAGAPFATTGLQAHGGNGIAFIQWDPNPAPDLDYYHIYRADSVGVWQIVASVTGTEQSYIDSVVSNGVEYFYCITAVDHDGIEGVSSNVVSTIPMGLYQDLLVVRETAQYPCLEWEDALVDSFYHQLFDEICSENGWQAPDYITLNTLSNFTDLPVLSLYLRVWYIHDNQGPVGILPSYQMDKAEILENYVAHGGKLIVSGRNIFYGAFYRGNSPWAPNCWSTMGEGTYWGNTLLHNYFKIDSVYAATPLLSLPPPLPDFIAALPTPQPGYPRLDVDSEKITQYYNPANYDYLPCIHAMIPNAQGEVLYTFESAWPDTAVLQGEAVGVRYLSDYNSTVILTFPLYAMAPYDSVKQLAKQILLDIPVGITEQESKQNLPQTYTLAQNYPNPFNPTTTIRFGLPASGPVQLSIYNLLGQKVADLVHDYRPAGYHQVIWNAQDLPSGMYVYRLQAGSYQAVKKMLLVK